MKTVAIPRVLISYTWRPDNPDDSNDDPEKRGLHLADRLRKAGFDCRIDQYFMRGLHGFVRPNSRVGDEVNDPWVMWQKEQIRAADFVLLVCSAQYSATVCESPLGEYDGDKYLTWEQWNSMPDDLKHKLHHFQMDESKGKKKKIPYTWWDWHFMIKEIESGRAGREKFIPVGFRSFSSISPHIPSFIRGETYYNLDSNDDFNGLLRNMELQFRKRHPRAGIFISYSHKDEKWLNLLRTHLSFLQQRGVEIWTDKEIRPGERWHREIEVALATAAVAVLLVTKEFLASPFIRDKELPALLHAAESEGLVIFWIPVEPSSYTQYEISSFQAAHTPDKPLSELRGAKRDEALVAIASRLAQRLGIVSTE